VFSHIISSSYTAVFVSLIRHGCWYLKQW